MVECDNPLCGGEAYATVKATDPNGHSEPFNLCGTHREEMYDGEIYETETVEKLN